MSPSAQGTIVTVTGNAQRRIEPDTATIRLSVSFDGRQRAAVLERCTHVAAKVHSSLEAMNDPERSPLTRWSQSQTSVWSDRPWNAEGRQLAPVYHAQVEFTATFADFGEMSVWLAATSAREGVAISRIEWDLTDDHRAEVEAEAHVQAVVQARAKADDYAAAIGLRIAAAIEIADRGLLSTSGVSPAFAEIGAKRAMAADGVAMRPEPVEIEASVDARFLAQ